MGSGTYSVVLTATNAAGSNVATKTGFISVNAAQTATPTPLITPGFTYAITAKPTTELTGQAWLDQENAKLAAITVAPTAKSPGYDTLSALIGCGAVAGIAVRRRR
jgi:PKD repeat protein